MDTPYLATFLGMPMQQTWEDLALWEEVLNRHRLHGVIEIGTGTGAFSTFLALQCKARKLRFMSFDIKPHTVENAVTQAIDLALRMRVGDVWGGCMYELMEALDQRSWRPVLLFCDGGDKPREVRRLAPLLCEGDVIAAHDWGTEIGPADVAGLVRLETVATGRLTRWWRVRGDCE